MAQMSGFAHVRFCTYFPMVLGKRVARFPYKGIRLLAGLYIQFAYLLLKENNMNKPIFQRIIDKLKIDQVTKCWEWQGELARGYGRIRINSKPIYTHRVMYKIFYGSIPEDKPCVLHHCDNPKCCNPLHLYAGTHQDNSRDMVKRNRCNVLHGEKHGQAKLTERQVLEIRESKETQTVIARRFNVSEMNIRYIKNRKTWKHL